MSGDGQWTIEVPCTNGAVSDEWKTSQPSTSADVPRMSPSAIAATETLCGVPMSQLNPSNAESRFTCHTFSSDGSRMATGETGGTVRVWSTEDYRVLEEGLELFERTVISLSFLDGKNEELVGMDDSGAVLIFSFESVKDVAAPFSGGRAQMKGTKCQIVGAIEKDKSLEDLSGQFSQDGKTLLRVRSKFGGQADILQLRHPIEGVDIAPAIALRLVYGLGSDSDVSLNICLALALDLGLLTALDFGLENNSKRQFCLQLAENGQYVLATVAIGDDTTFNTILYAVDALFGRGSKERVIFTRAHGVWGRNGEYLMLWRNELSGNPTLEVVTTDGLTQKSKGIQHKLECGLLRWNARMLEGEDACVAIHTIATSGKHRIHLWDVDSDVVKSEVVFDMRPERGILFPNSTRNRGPPEDAFESALRLESTEALIQMTMEGAHTTFAVSKDREWAMAFSSRSYSCAICSLSSSFALWSFTIPENVSSGPSRMRNRMLFDSHGRPLLLKDTAILVTLPRFLSQGSQYDRSEYFPSGEEELDSYLKSTLAHIPVEALARVAAAEETISSVQYPGQQIKVQPVIDIAVSQRGDLVAMITRSEEGMIIVAGQATDFVRAHVEGHWPVFFLQENIDCDRVFLFADNQDADIMALLNFKSKDLTFFRVRDGSSKVEELEIDDTFQSVTQSQDRQRLIFNNSSKVFIYNLQKRDKSHTFYITPILINTTESSSSKYFPKEQGSIERRVSADGNAVLLAWDVKNEQSIVVRPRTRACERESKISAAGESISDFCSLSNDGRTTLFVDIKALSWGLLIVGIFEESIQRVTKRFILQRLSSSMSDEDIKIVLNNVLFDLTPDGSTLIVVRTPCRELKSMSLDYCIAKFDVRLPHGCFVDYDQLIAQPNFDVNTTPEELFRQFGLSVFNVPHSGWLSLFQEAILRRRLDLVESIQDIAERNDALLSIQPQGALIPKMETNCVLENLLSSESTNDVHKAMDLICSKTTPFNMMAEGMSLAFSILSFKHPYFIREALSNNALKYRICELDVHVDFMDAKLRRDKAIHINTRDNLASWKMIDNPTALKANWQEENKETIQRMEKEGNDSTTRAILIFICIANAAKVGMSGIIRLLLMQNAPARVFKLDIVKWIIMYKWKIWQKRAMRQVMIYVFFLMTYTTYALLLGYTADLCEEPIWKKCFMTAVLIVVFGFGIRMLIEEVSQAKTFIREGRELKQKWTWGLCYHFRSGWNWVDLISCLMLVLMLPLFHILAITGFGFEEALSAFAAIEAIVAALKMWYFAHPFRRTGALVLMVNNIVRDCLPLLILTVLVSFGFAVALFVLFRHAIKRGLSGDVLDEASDSFSSFPRSLVALFYALLANFEPKVFWSAGNLSVLVIFVFAFFLVAQLIVLINLLIAIMGDTFDRVKSTEEDQLLMGRAIFIDSSEAALSEANIEELNKEIGKYVCVLMPSDDESERDPADEWMGRMKAMEESFNTALKKSEKKLLEKMQHAMDSMKAEMQQSLQQFTETAKSTTKRPSHLEARIERMDRKIETKLDMLVAFLQQSHAT